MSKSALTAAMSSGTGAPPPAPSESKDDHFSFPCLTDPKAELHGDAAEAMAAAKAETEGYVPVGSMPTYDGDDLVSRARLDSASTSPCHTPPPTQLA
jgi:hypothetical protein